MFQLSGVQRIRRAFRISRRSIRRRRKSSRMNAGTRNLVALTLFAAACSGLPPTVERITIANPTGYALDVDVTSEDRSGWLSVAIVEARSEDVAQDVIDQGDVWIFRFVHWGDPVGELRLTRAELERNGWRVEVPAEVEVRLQEQGRPTSGKLLEPEQGGET
jgi:hypothetical protein